MRDGELVASPRVIAAIQLGRWSGTSVSALTADNVFDDTLYSSYLITGQFLPATDNVSFLATLRTGFPSDVGGGLKTGGTFGRLDAAGSGTVSNLAVLSANVGSAAGRGILAFEMHLHVRNGVRHSFSQYNTVVHNSGARYAINYSGEFIDVTPRQGIKFSFSSGNIADGWFEILGIKKQ